LKKGDIITFSTKEEFLGTAQKVYMTYKSFPQDVNPGESILLDDGKFIFTVLDTDGVEEVRAVVVQGGPLRSKKGVNLLNTKVSLPYLSENDMKDALFDIILSVDLIRLSLVRT